MSSTFEEASSQHGNTLHKAFVVSKQNAKAAAILVQDALDHRSHRHPLDAVSLVFYQYYHDKTWKPFIMTMMSLHLVLGLFEAPFSAFDAAIPTPGPAVLDLLCGLFYMTDNYFYWRAMGKSTNLEYLLSHNRWKPLVILANFALIFGAIVGLSLPGLTTPRLRWLRPIFIAERSPELRTVANNIVRSVRTVLPILLLTVCYTLLFALAGFVLFKDAEHDYNEREYGGARPEYFSSVPQSIISMTTLLATANNPDVMLLVFQDTPWASIFFVVYILGGIFFLVQLLLAIVLDDMASNLEVSVRRSIARTRIAYEKAYDLLVPDEVSGISAGSWKQLVQFLRPEWIKSGVAEMLFAYVDSFDEEAQSHDITLEEFRHAMLYFKYEIKVSKKQYKALHSAYILEVQAMLEASSASTAAGGGLGLQPVAEGTSPGNEGESPNSAALGTADIAAVSTSEFTRTGSLSALSMAQVVSGATSNPMAERTPAASTATPAAVGVDTDAAQNEAARSSSSMSSQRSSVSSQSKPSKVRPLQPLDATNDELLLPSRPAAAAPAESSDTSEAVSDSKAATPRPSSSTSQRPGSAGRGATPAPSAPVAPGAAAMRLPGSSSAAIMSTPRSEGATDGEEGDGDELFEEDPVLCGICSDRGCCARCCGVPAEARDRFRVQLLSFSDKLKSVLGYRVNGWGVAELVFNVFVAINLGCVVATIVLEANGRTSDDSIMRALVALQYLFLLLFIIEVALKLTAYGLEEFWRRSVSNQMDIVLLVASLVAESVLLVNSTTGVIDAAVSSSNTAAVVSVSRVFRLLRLLRALRAFRKVFSTIGQMVPVLTGVFSVLILMFYSFAMVGIDIWGGQIDRADLEENHPDNLYVTAAYWGLNFDSLPRAMLCCLTFVVVNNFFVLLDGLSATASLSIAWAYFGVFYVSVVLIAVNVLVAIIFQAFVFKYRHDDGLILSGSEQQQFIKVAADGTPYRTRDEMKLSALDSATLIMARDLEWFIFERFQRKAHVQQKLTLRHLELETTAATMEATGLDEGIDSDEDAEWADEEYNTMLQSGKAGGDRKRSFFSALGFSWRSHSSSSDSAGGGTAESAAGSGHHSGGSGHHSGGSGHHSAHMAGRKASMGPALPPPMVRRMSRGGSSRRRGSFMAQVVGGDVDPYRREELADGIVHAMRGGAPLLRQEATVATHRRPTQRSFSGGNMGHPPPAVALGSRAASEGEAAAPTPHPEGRTAGVQGHVSRPVRNFKQRLQAYRAQRMLAADVAESLARQATGESTASESEGGLPQLTGLPHTQAEGGSDAYLQRMGAAIAAARLLARRASGLRASTRHDQLQPPAASDGRQRVAAGAAESHGTESSVPPAAEAADPPVRARRRWSSLRGGVSAAALDRNSGGAATPWSVALAALAERNTQEKETA